MLSPRETSSSLPLAFSLVPLEPVQTAEASLLVARRSLSPREMAQSWVLVLRPRQASLQQEQLRLARQPHLLLSALALEP